MTADAARLRAYDDVTTRIWRDKRCTPGTRELMLALAWVLERDPDYNDTTASNKERGRYAWRQMDAMLGRDRYGRARYKQLLADDAPRYEPSNDWDGRVCEAPRIRPYRPRTADTPPLVSNTCLIRQHPHLGACRYAVVQGSVGTVVKPAPEQSPICGAHPKWEYRLVERDPRTGWHIGHYFCARHRDQYERVRAQLANAAEAPEPIPNAGGLLPSYFKADWVRMYTLVRPHWKPPTYGISADDWPGAISGGVTPRHPMLRLILGEMADA